MTIHTNPPLPRIVASGGPVSRAIRIMTEADPELARIRELRRAIAARIESDIELLDALAGDPDLEDGGDDEETGDDEPSLGSLEHGSGSYVVGFLTVDPTTGQGGWGGGGVDDREQDAGDDREQEDEHGGDIQDEPHDEESDREPSFGGITVDPRFANGTDEGEASLGSLGGTAAGCEQSQKGWDKGDRRDREIDGGSRVHTQDSLRRDPGGALTAVEDWRRNLRRPRQGGSIQIVGPHGIVYNVQSCGRGL